MMVKNHTDIARLYQDHMLNNRNVRVKNGYEADFQRLLDNTLGNEIDRRP